MKQKKWKNSRKKKIWRLGGKMISKEITVYELYTLIKKRPYQGMLFPDSNYDEPYIKLYKDNYYQFDEMFVHEYSGMLYGVLYEKADFVEGWLSDVRNIYLKNRLEWNKIYNALMKEVDPTVIKTVENFGERVENYAIGETRVDSHTAERNNADTNFENSNEAGNEKQVSRATSHSDGFNDYTTSQASTNTDTKNAYLNTKEVTAKDYTKSLQNEILFRTNFRFFDIIFADFRKELLIW